ncbi:MAG: aldo/keto reductase [Opitutales bacterium]
MRYVTLGKTGLEVSKIGFGGMPIGVRHHSRNFDPYTSEGRAHVIRVMHLALDLGINYIDTAPSYGTPGVPEEQGQSERMIGEALEGGRREKVVLATKFGCGMEGPDVARNVEESLRRLRTDYVDVLQLHGGRYNPQLNDKILNGGTLAAAEKLRDEGKVRFLGFTSEQAWSAIPLIESGRFDMCQVCHGLIYQHVAEEAMDAAHERGMYVAIMRPLASSRFHRILQAMEPRWLETRSDYDLCLKFLLSDSRVDVINVGMRFEDEVRHNVELVNSFEPTMDIARETGGMWPAYQAEDRARGLI